MKGILLKDPKVDEGAMGTREGVDDSSEGGGLAMCLVLPAQPHPTLHSLRQACGFRSQHQHWFRFLEDAGVKNRDSFILFSSLF